MTTLPLYALDVLSSPQAEARTGRRGRILMGFEERLLLEDVKTSGVAPRRLSEMLKFFYRSWADLEPMSGDWFYDEQEERVFRLLVRLLAPSRVLPRLRAFPARPSITASASPMTWRPSAAITFSSTTTKWPAARPMPRGSSCAYGAPCRKRAVRPHARLGRLPAFLGHRRARCRQPQRRSRNPGLQPSQPRGNRRGQPPGCRRGLDARPVPCAAPTREAARRWLSSAPRAN